MQVDHVLVSEILLSQIWLEQFLRIIEGNVNIIKKRARMPIDDQKSNNQKFIDLSASSSFPIVNVAVVVDIVNSWRTQAYINLPSDHLHLNIILQYLWKMSQFDADHTLVSNKSQQTSRISQYSISTFRLLLRYPDWRLKAWGYW